MTPEQWEEIKSWAVDIAGCLCIAVMCLIFWLTAVYLAFPTPPGQ